MKGLLLLSICMMYTGPPNGQQEERKREEKPDKKIIVKDVAKTIETGNKDARIDHNDNKGKLQGKVPKKTTASKKRNGSK